MKLTFNIKGKTRTSVTNSSGVKLHVVYKKGFHEGNIIIKFQGKSAKDLIEALGDEFEPGKTHRERNVVLSIK